jgi:hypothetical protein
VYALHWLENNGDWRRKLNSQERWKRTKIEQSAKSQTIEKKAQACEKEKQNTQRNEASN